MKNKLCPILSISNKMIETMGVSERVECVQNYCAWWDKQNECCSFSCYSSKNVDVRSYQK